MFFFSFFKNINNKSSKIEKLDLTLNSKENFSNTIENIEYSSNDNLGNQYVIKAKYGEIMNENKDLILMKDVVAVIILSDYEEINITSSTAVYDIMNYNTNFKKNVFIKYAEHNLTCDNVDLLIKKHKINLYNNINYNNLKTDFLADRMEIDFLTKDSKTFMYDKNKKVKAIYNNNVSN